MGRTSMKMILLIKGCFHILLDLPLVTTHMDRIRMVILLNHIPNRATHLLDILLLVGVRQQVTLPQVDTHRRVILLLAVTPQLVTLARQLPIIQGMDRMELVWGRC